MKTLRNIFIVLMIAFNHLFAQNLMKDQDLVTVKSGAQYLGYIIEQQPGKLVKMYRPTQNDTISIQMEDIDKLTKIMVQTFSEKKKNKKDSVLMLGRFNNKKNIYQFSFGTVRYAQGEMNQPYRYMGGSIAYYRSFKNRYMPGLSVGVYGLSEESEEGNSVSGTYYYDYFKRQSHVMCFLMAENRFRLGKRYQNRRLTTMIGLNLGYVFDGRYGLEYTFSNGIYKQNYHETKNNFMLQTAFCFKVNPDNNSGFIIEPSITYYNPITKHDYHENEITIDPVTGDTESKRIVSKYLGYTRDFPLMLTFRLSYFF